MKLEQTALQSILNEQEYRDFEGVLTEVCRQEPSIIGVLAIGSLVQDMRLPDPSGLATPRTEREEIYDVIRNRGRRRIFPSANSDLDLWICTQNPFEAQYVEHAIEYRAIELIDTLINDRSIHGTNRWIELKQKAFGAFYKKDYLYTDQWKTSNQDAPWNAEDFKTRLISELMYWLPDVVRRVNYNFKKQIPGDFLEVRAYPECTFNLRPEDLVIDGVVEKSPFPRIVNNDWLDINRNAMVLYVTDQVSPSTIYPFQEDGRRLGNDIQQFISEA